VGVGGVPVPQGKALEVLHAAQPHQRTVAVHLQLEGTPEQALQCTNTKCSGSHDHSDSGLRGSLRDGVEPQETASGQSAVTKRGRCTHLCTTLRAMSQPQVSIGEAAAQGRVRLEGAQGDLQVRHGWERDTGATHAIGGNAATSNATPSFPFSECDKVGARCPLGASTTHGSVVVTSTLSVVMA